MPGRNIYKRRRLGAGDEKEAPPPRQRLGGDEREGAEGEGPGPVDVGDDVAVAQHADYRIPSLLSEDPPPPPPPSARRVVDDEPDPVKKAPALVVYDPKPAEEEATKRRKKLRYKSLEAATEADDDLPG